MCRSARVAAFLLCVVATTMSPALAQEDSDRSPSRIVEQFISAYNAHDVGAMLAFVHPDVQWLSVEGDTVLVQTSGAVELAEALKGYFKSVPSSRSTVESMMAAGRFVSVWERAHWERNGAPASQSALAVYEIQDDHIVRVWYYPSMEVASAAPEALEEQPAPTSGNPIMEGWYADPEGLVFGDTYWVYPTYSARYEKQVFFDAFSSKDLVTWEKHERILDTTAVDWAWRAMWAPSAIEKDGKYYFFFAANDIQSDDEVGGIGVAVADSPGGPFKDHLGRPLIDKLHNGAQPIDQFVFRDGDDYYMFYGG